MEGSLDPRGPKVGPRGLWGTLGMLLGTPWGTLGGSWGAAGGPQGGLGGAWGTPGESLGVPWMGLGVPWAATGRSLGSPGDDFGVYRKRCISLVKQHVLKHVGVFRGAWGWPRGGGQLGERFGTFGVLSGRFMRAWGPS